MKTRNLRPELMDDPHLDRSAHFQALKGLERLNRITRNAALSYRPLRELARSLRTETLRVLDIGTGAGDVPIGLCRRSAREGLSFQIDACDVSEQALEFARQNIRRAKVSVRLFRLDVLEDDITEPYDAVICSTFLHHFTDQEAEHILRKMTAAARGRVVVVDLARSRLNWWQVWLATRMFSRSGVVHFDGPQSIKAAFTPREVRQLAERAGLKNIRLRRSWPCRFVLTGEPG